MITMHYRYWTKTAGVGGRLKEEEDFIVNEIIDQKFLRRFRRTRDGIGQMHGKYSIFRLKKKGLTTAEAIEILSKRLKIPKAEFGYAGLKDKFSVSSQYMTVKSGIVPVKTKRLEISDLRAIDRPIQTGDLVGNEFFITLHCCRNISGISKAVRELEKRGMPNYFGRQRFGKNGNNHIIGRLLVKRDFYKALDRINNNCSKKYTHITEVPKTLLKFFLHAYQSFLFNEVLDRYIGRNSKAYFSPVPILGYDTRLTNSRVMRILKDIMKEEGIKQGDFRINELRLSCKGSERSLFIKPLYIEYKTGENLSLRFILPKGSYATVLLGEVCKP